MGEFISAHPAVAVAGVVFLGVSAQLVAQRLRLPSILLLLLFGFSVSPAGLGGDLLSRPMVDEPLFFALISSAVAVVLFEGGLTLSLHELSHISRPLTSLITLGAFISWGLTTAAGVFLLGAPFKIALLLGAILVVTGPTVIGPLLRHVRPVGRVSAIVKWEGILNDPVGALLAVLVFEAILPHAAGDEVSVLTIVSLGVGRTIVVGGLLGFATAAGLVAALKRHWIPDHLQGITSLALVLSAFVASNLVQHESGLLTVTLMGIMLANQRQVPVKHIVEFKEHLGVLFISCLFIVLSARLTPEKLELIDFGSVLFLLAMILIVRPASVFLSFQGSDLSWREKLFVAWMAPRGIVAAAVASLFALRLGQAKIPGAEMLEPTMFLVIVGTVSVYGLTAAPIARALGVASKSREGLLFVGAHDWARRMASVVQSLGIPVLLVDTNRQHALLAQLDNLPAIHGNILDEATFENLDLSGIGRMLALTTNEEANSLASLQCSEEFGRVGVYQVRLKTDVTAPSGVAPYLHGRALFREGTTHSFLSARIASGAQIRSVRFADGFGLKELQEQCQGKAIVLMLRRGEQLLIDTSEAPLAPQEGDTVIYVSESKGPNSARLPGAAPNAAPAPKPASAPTGLSESPPPPASSASHSAV